MKKQRRALREQRRVVRRIGPSLTLKGWNGYREQLIEREQENFELKVEPLLIEAPSHVDVQGGGARV